MKTEMELYYDRCKKLKSEGLTNEELNNYENYKEVFSEEIFKEIMKEKAKRKQKRNRTKNKFFEMIKIKNMIPEKTTIVFGTMTLDEKHIKQKEDTYIRNIHKWLKEHFIYAILNKDFGEKNGREHYHFIGITTEELEDKNKKSKKGYKEYELVNKNYTLGFEPTLLIVNLNEENIKQTVNYLLKLNNHSTKNTAKSRVRIVKTTKSRVALLLHPESVKKGKIMAKYKGNKIKKICEN